MTSGIWAIIPVKKLSLAKSRLGEVLTPEQRGNLSLLLLKSTLEQVSRLNEIKGTIVVSRDKLVLRIAKEQQCQGLLEQGKGDLNHALDQATQYAIRNNARGVLIVPTDLPYLEAEILSRFMSLSLGGREMIISPDYREEGTNVMLLFPPGMVEYCYGNNSFVLHIEQARKNNMQLAIYRHESLQFDLDLPEDLTMLVSDKRFQDLYRKDMRW